MNISKLTIAQLKAELTIETIKEVSTVELVSFWNAHHADALIKKFADRKTAERRVLALVDKLEVPAEEVQTVEVYKTRESRTIPGAANLAQADAEPEFVSPNSDKPEEEITEEEALAELALMRASKGQAPELTEEQADARKKAQLSIEKQRAAIKASWADPEVAAKRQTRDSVIVTVNGKSASFRSVAAAFKEFNLPLSKHIRFRMNLKEKKALGFEHNGSVYAFAISDEPSAE